MGETFPASRAGRRQEAKTVAAERRAAPMKMRGLTETDISPSAIPNSTGTSSAPSPHPASSPSGMPAAQRMSASP